MLNFWILRRYDEYVQFDTYYVLRSTTPRTSYTYMTYSIGWGTVVRGTTGTYDRVRMYNYVQVRIVFDIYIVIIVSTSTTATTTEYVRCGCIRVILRMYIVH